MVQVSGCDLWYLHRRQVGPDLHINDICLNYKISNVPATLFVLQGRTLRHALYDISLDGQ
jgi:hypothetical protein